MCITMGGAGLVRKKPEPFCLLGGAPIARCKDDVLENDNLCRHEEIVYISTIRWCFSAHISVISLYNKADKAGL